MYVVLAKLCSLLDKAAKPATRPPTASPATGNKVQHIREEHELLAEALVGEAVASKNVNGVPVWVS